jgi:hypothetical protein
MVVAITYVGQPPSFFPKPDLDVLIAEVVDIEVSRFSVRAWRGFVQWTNISRDVSSHHHVQVAQFLLLTLWCYDTRPLGSPREVAGPSSKSNETSGQAM